MKLESFQEVIRALNEAKVAYILVGGLAIAEGIEAPVVTLGALLRMKQAAGRPQDLEDIRALTDLYGL